MRRPLILLLGLALLAGACGDDGTRTVTVLAHDFFAVPEDVLAGFEAETGIEVEIVLGGDTGLMVNQALLTAGNPIADVIFGVDTTLVSRAVDGGLFDPYVSTDLAAISSGIATGGGTVTPIDFGDVCLNHDLALVPDPPETLADLVEFAGVLSVPDPRASSPGLAFLLATIDRFGEEGAYTWKDFWSDLTAGGVEIAADWGTSYYGSFSAIGGGDRTIVVSYASSPPAEVLFADPPIDLATTGVITDGCFRQTEYAGVLRGSDDVDAARRFIDFMVSETFQATVATSMFVFPIDPSIELPAVFRENTTVPADPIEMDPDRIEANRDRWLAEWSEIVLG